MTNRPIHTVEDILAGTVKNGFDGSIQTAGSFIFGDSDATLPYSQKRAFLTAVEGMRYRDNHGQDHLRPSFTVIETGVEPALAEEVRNQLLALCETGLLGLISDSPHRYAFTDASFVFIANYFTLREFHEGGGRAKLPPDLSYKTVILPSIQTSAKSFVQLLKSIQRRRFEAETGTLMQLQDKDAHDYESITRIAFSLQTPTFFVDPAISFEVIPLEQSRVKVVAQCYHVLAEESFDFALREISETWPEAATGEGLQGITAMADTIPKLNYAEQKIKEVFDRIVAKGQLHPTDDAIAAQLPIGRKGQPYTRETVNRYRNKMRGRGIEV